MFATALTSYVNRIAPKAEHTATLSAGVAANHVAAVLMPLAGGIAWSTGGSGWTFLIGSSAAVVSLIVVALKVPRLP
jgi:MFS family permease